MEPAAAKQPMSATYDHTSTSHNASTSTQPYAQKQTSPLQQLPRHHTSPTPVHAPLSNIYPTSSNSKNNLTSPSPSQGQGLAFFGSSGSGGGSGSGGRDSGMNSGAKVRIMMAYDQVRPIESPLSYSHSTLPTPPLLLSCSPHTLFFSHSPFRSSSNNSNHPPLSL